jgi:hypothetical protein
VASAAAAAEISDALMAMPANVSRRVGVMFCPGV